jgi:nitrite reductase/ring-hydroxylating ferredoxin subunit
MFWISDWKEIEESWQMGFVNVTSRSDLKPGEMMNAEVEGKEICVANVEGKYYAIGNRCTHMSCLLSDGTLEGTNVICSCHNSVFNIETGAVVKGSAKKAEPAFEVKVEGDQVLVNV